jgi:hypothetical protein
VGEHLRVGEGAQDVVSPERRVHVQAGEEAGGGRVSLRGKARLPGFFGAGSPVRASYRMTVRMTVRLLVRSLVYLTGHHFSSVKMAW